MLRALHHVQLAMPPGGEDLARGFYGRVLGLDEARKPKGLSGRGGAWFERGDLRVHLGVETRFRPARKAHPAFLVDDLAGLSARLAAAGCTVREDGALPGYARFYAEDPFGNRLEFLCPEIPPGL